jgi:hypothetical protein
VVVDAEARMKRALAAVPLTCDVIDAPDEV